MANAFKLNTKKNIGTADSAIYTCPSATETTIIGLNLANTTTSAIEANVKLLNNGGDSCFVIKSAPIPIGSSLVPVGGDQKLVMNANDVIQVSSSAASSIDVCLSILEIT